MSQAQPLFVFFVAGRRLALPLEHVERVLRVVEIMPLPQSSPLVRGVINVRGQIVPVIDLHQYLGLSRHDLELSDQLVLTRIAQGSFALLVDRVEGVLTAQDIEPVALHTLMPDQPGLNLVKHGDDVIMIPDLEALLAGENVAVLAELGVPQAV